MTGPDGPGESATRTPREVGHRRKVAPTVEDMASPPRVRLGRVAALIGAVALTATVSAVSLVREPATSAAAGTGATVVETVAPVITAAGEQAHTTRELALQTQRTKALAEKKAKQQAAKAKASPPPPASSGEGRRIVFDQSDQRVWLIEADGTVDRTYLVSGSRFDNLQPGSYAVQSRTRHATSFDYTGTMEYFVQFTTGQNAPIGFHSIPVYNNGKPEQTIEQLGQALSAGCIRQEKSDAKYLWDWAPDGTPVVVTA